MPPKKRTRGDVNPPETEARVTRGLEKRQKVVQAVVENQEQSPLLGKLPREVRDQIWREVVGDQIIHVHETPPRNLWTTNDQLNAQRSLVSSVCVSCDRERDLLDGAYVRDHLRDPGDESSQSTRSFVHAACQDGDIRKPIDLRLLRVCRQVYKEASGFQYTTNLFAIDCPFAFRAFSVAFKNFRKTLPKRQNTPLIHGLHLTAFEAQWNYRSICRLTDVSLVPYVKHVYLSVSLDYTQSAHYAGDHNLVYSSMRDSSIWSWLPRLISKIKVSRAKAITVHVREKLPQGGPSWLESDEEGDDEPKWEGKTTTKEMRDEMAEIIKIACTGTKEQLDAAREAGAYKDMFKLW